MGVSINRATNCNIYVDGSNYLGKADEVTLPQPKAKESDHNPLGIFGALKYPSGIDNMEAKIKWNSYYLEAIRKFGNIFTATKIQVRWSLETYSGNSRVGSVPAVAYITARPNDMPGGNFKSKDNVELESNLSVSYYKLEINGEELIEYDAEANIYKVDGVDLLADYRAHLGI